MKDRITLLIKAKNYTSAQFADEIGVQKSGISHIISGRNNPSLDFVQKILLRFPEVSMDWLILGKGPMFFNEAVKPLEEQSLFPSVLPVQKTPDLFTWDEVVPDEKDNHAQLRDSSEPEALKKEIQSEKYEYIDQQPKSAEKKIPADALMAPAGIDKKLEKIVFFYSDKSFKEYFPEA